jgi:ElaB/YqjD/DUF883 family membrane-anchored ribosome-binding protein
MSTFNTADIGKASTASIDHLADKAGDVIEQVQVAAHKVVGQVQSEAKDLTQEAPKLVDLAADALKAYTRKGASLAKDASALAREKAGVYADSAANRVRKDPLKAILVAAAAGAAVALVASYAAKKRNAAK